MDPKDLLSGLYGTGSKSFIQLMVKLRSGNGFTGIKDSP
jgi:hypothetical protein